MKIALCISGQMRTYEECYPNLKKYILDPLQPDIFIHTWEGSGISHKENIHIEEKIVLYSELEKLYAPKKVVIEQFDKSYLDKFSGVKVPNLIKEKEPNQCKGSIPLFYKMNKCNELKKEFEKEFDFKYDVVIKLRPDLMILEPLKIQNIYKNKLYFSNYAINQNYQLSDKFAYGSSKVMDQYTSVWNYLNEYWKTPLGDGNWESHRVGERLMFHHVNNYFGLNNQAFKLKCYIKRYGDSSNPYSLKERVSKKIINIIRSIKK